MSAPRDRILMATVDDTEMRRECGKASLGMLPFMLLAALVLINYVGTLRAEFVYDDHMQLVENVALRNLRNIPLFFTDPAYTMGPMIFEEIYRPLRTTFFAVEYQFWGLNPVGFHAVNVAFHLVNSFLVFLFLSRIFRSRTPSLAAALLFAAHPALTENVCWVCSRADLLCMFFYLIALLCYLRGREEAGPRRMALFVTSLAAMSLALLSKEMGVTFPIAIVAIDLWREGFKRQSPKRWMEYAPFVVITIAYLVFRINIVSQFAQREPWGETPLATAAIMAKGIAYYIRLLLFPFKITVLPFIDTDVSLLDAEVMLAAALVGCLIAAALMLRRRYPLASLGVILFFILSLPVSNIVPIKTVVADRFIYIPSLGFFMVAAALFRAFEPFQPRCSPRRVALTKGAIAILIFLFSVNTIARTVDWRNDITLFSSAVEVAPDNPRARTALGKEYAFRGNHEAAREQALLVLRDNPENPRAHTLLGNIHLENGLLSQAESEFKAALELDPHSSIANNGLGMIYRQQGKLDEALAAFETGLKEKPVGWKTLNNAGSVLLEQGKVALALEYFTRALEVRPSAWEATCNAALALLRLRRYSDAVSLLENFLSRHPGDVQTLILLGSAYSGAKNYKAAVSAYDRAIAADPADMRARAFLANLHMEHGEYDKAAFIYRNILKKYPTGVHFRISLASALENMGQLDAAVKELQIAVRLNPEDASLRYKLAETLKKAGKPADAQKEYDRAEQLSPTTEKKTLNINPE